MQEFSDLLRLLRQEAGLSQNALARTIGVDPSYINRIENGSRQPPSAAVVVRMAKALRLAETTIDELLLSAGYAPVSNPVTSLRATHPSLQLLSDFLSDMSVPNEDMDMIERDLNLLEEHIRLIRKRRLANDSAAAETDEVG
jgi:transcriptional regulator with XRE-family HTH domain